MQDLLGLREELDLYLPGLSQVRGPPHVCRLLPLNLSSSLSYPSRKHNTSDCCSLPCLRPSLHQPSPGSLPVSPPHPSPPPPFLVSLAPSSLTLSLPSPTHPFTPASLPLLHVVCWGEGPSPRLPDASVGGGGVPPRLPDVGDLFESVIDFAPLHIKQRFGFKVSKSVGLGSCDGSEPA